ncbi:trypsin-like serine protease [Pseudomonas sp. PICF141]|uniref:trypsin-like serine protease n=1 Tax=Pseudomonas sp. PICF141 TaxID=1949067 RepID=UPI00117B2664|nr:trypsin-like serine protease [Pseudomonas sp. PICF141]
MKLSRAKIKIITTGVAFLASFPAPAAKFYCDNKNTIATADETTLIGQVIKSKKTVELQILMIDSEKPTLISTIQSANTVTLGGAKFNIPVFAQSHKNSSAAISMNAQFIVDQSISDIAKASYINQSTKYFPYKTIPDEKLKTEIEKLIKDEKKSGELADLFNSTGKKCTKQITDQYQLEFNALDGPDFFQFTRDLINNEQLFKESHPGVVIDKYKSFIKTTKKLLDNCYLPAELSEFGKKHNLLNSIGSIYNENMPICTGLIFKKNNHVLTARHCFEFLKNIELQKNLRNNLWFKKASEDNEYQVCAILERDALDKRKFDKAIDDQVVIRIAAPSTNAPPIEIVSRNSIKIPSADTSPANKPTSLLQISLFPFAKLIRPETFKSGFVQSTNPACIALSKEEGCFGHTCSAIRGGSGASIFLAESNNISLVGTHIGADSKALPDCKAPQQRQINSATYIESALKK